MKKRFFLLLLAMLLLCQPVTVLADDYTDDGDKADEEADEDSDNGDEGESYGDPKDGEDAYNVQIGVNTKLTTKTDTSEYRTAIACSLRSTDDHYYSTIVNGIPSALSWWEYHASNGVQYMGDQLTESKMTTLLKSLTYYAKTDKFWTITVNGVTYEPGDDVDWRKISIGKVPNSAQKRFQEWYTNCYIKSIIKSADTQDLFSRVAPGGKDSSLVKDWPSSISEAKNLEWKPSYSGTCEIISPTSTRSNYWNYVYAVYYNMLEDYEKFLKTVDKNNTNRDDTSGFLTSKFLKDYWDPDSFRLKDGATNEGFDTVAYHLPNTVVDTHIYVLYNNTSPKSGDSDWHPTHRYADKNMSGTNANLYLYLRAGVARNSTECAYLNTTYSTKKKRVTSNQTYETANKKTKKYKYDSYIFTLPSDIATQLQRKYVTDFRPSTLKVSSGYSASDNTQKFQETTGGNTELKMVPGDDIALMLYTVNDYSATYAEQIRNVKPVDMYSHAKTWYQLVEKGTMSNYYTLFTGKTQYLLGNKAPSHYTFDHVSYTNAVTKEGKISGNNGVTQIHPSMTSLKDFYSLLPVDDHRIANFYKEDLKTYGWCGKITNTHGGYTYNYSLKDEKGYNYTTSKNYSKFSTNFKKYSILYKILFPNNGSSVKKSVKVNGVTYPNVKSQYESYFDTSVNEQIAMSNVNKVLSQIPSGDSSPVVGQKQFWKKITLTNVKDGTSKTVKLYLGMYDDLFERSYHSQMWKSIGMQAGQKHQGIMNKYGDDSINYGENDYVLWTDKLDSKNPSKVSKGSQAPIAYNLYHWITGTSAEYDGKAGLSTEPYLAPGDNSTEMLKSKNYLYYVYDWYRSQPMTEITAWYRPYKYKVVYKSNLPGDSSSFVQSELTSAPAYDSKGNRVQTSDLVFYDYYGVQDVNSLGLGSAEDIMRRTGYVFRGWSLKSGDNNTVDYHPTNTSYKTEFSANDPSAHPGFYIDTPDANGKTDGKTVCLYGVWEKSRYYVRYYANRPGESGVDNQYWPTTFNMNDKSDAGEPIFKSNTADAKESNPIASVEQIQKHMGGINSAFYKPGYYIAGWTIGNPGGDTCGTNYYNGSPYNLSTSKTAHTNMTTPADGWNNTIDSTKTFYLQPNITDKGVTDRIQVGSGLSESMNRDKLLFGSSLRSGVNFRSTHGNLYEKILKNTSLPTLNPNSDPDMVYFCNDPTDGVNDVVPIDGEFYHIGDTSTNSKSVWTEVVAYYQAGRYTEDALGVVNDRINTPRWYIYKVSELEEVLNSLNNNNYYLRDYYLHNELNVDFGMWIKEFDAALVLLRDSLPSLNGEYRKGDQVYTGSEYESATVTAIETVKSSLNSLSNYAGGVTVSNAGDFANDVLSFTSSLEELDSFLSDAYSKYYHSVPMDELLNEYRNTLDEIDYIAEYNKNHHGVHMSDEQERKRLDLIRSQIPFAAYKSFLDCGAKTLLEDLSRIVTEAKTRYYYNVVRPAYHEAFTVYPVVTFYAHWEPERFYVRYNANDATANKFNVQSTDPTKQLPYNPATAKFTYNNRVTESQKGNSANKQAFIWEEVHYDDPKVAYKDVSGWWMRENEKDVSNFKGLTDIVEYTGANAYKANKDRSDASSQNTLETGRTLEYSGIRKRLGIVEGFDSNHFDYIYDLYAMFDDWPILRMGDVSNYVGDSITYAQASNMTAGFTGTNLDGHTGTALEDYLLSTKMVDNKSYLRLVAVSYDREDCARNGYSSPMSNNTWANPFGNSSTMFNTFDKALDPTNAPVPEAEGNTARVAIPTNGSTGATKYYIRFLDPKYILSSADSNSVDPVQTKYELRYYIKDSDEKGYEQNGVFYVGSSLEDIMVNSGGGN